MGLELRKTLLTLKLVPRKTAVWPHAGLDLAGELGTHQFRHKGQRAWLSKCEDNLKFHFVSCVFTGEQLKNSSGQESILKLLINIVNKVELLNEAQGRRTMYRSTHAS